VTAYVALIYIISAAVTAFAATRPSSAWLHADRDKTWWVMFMVVMTFLGPFGLISAAAFLVGVLPRMHSTEASHPEEQYESNPFRKR
jgi:hypothetical protein